MGKSNSLYGCVRLIQSRLKDCLSLQFASLSEEFVVVPANVVLKCTRCKLSSRRALISSFTQFSRLLDKWHGLSQDSVKRFVEYTHPWVHTVQSCV